MITTLINVAITDVLSTIQTALKTTPTTIATVVPTTIVTTILTSIRLHPTSLTVVSTVTRDMIVTNALAVTHAAVIGPLVPLPDAVIRNLLREVLADPAQPEVILLAPNMMMYLLNVGDSCLGDDMSA